MHGYDLEFVASILYMICKHNELIKLYIIRSSCNTILQYITSWTPFQYPVRLRRLEAARLVDEIIISIWNLTGASAALLPMSLSNFKAITHFLIQISRLRPSVRSYNKTSFRILKQGPGHRYDESADVLCWCSKVYYHVTFCCLFYRCVLGATFADEAFRWLIWD